jgi:hypothetical protein
MAMAYHGIGMEHDGDVIKKFGDIIRIGNLFSDISFVVLTP